MIAAAKSDTLLAVPPSEIRRKLVGGGTIANIVVVDAAWTGRPVDVHVGDHLLLPADALIDQRPSLLLKMTGDVAAGVLWEAKRPGIGRIVGSGWSSFVRVSRHGYIGRSMFRHLEPAGDDDASQG